MTVLLLHSERPKLYTILAFLSAVGLTDPESPMKFISNDFHWTFLVQLIVVIENKLHFIMGTILSSRVIILDLPTQLRLPHLSKFNALGCIKL